MPTTPSVASASALIGRAAEVDRAVSAVRHGSGVVLLGPAGVGKTSVARAVISRLDPRQACVVWLTATEAGRHLPFGVAAALMPTSSSADVTVVLPQVREALRARAGGRLLVLVVDDAHLLDGPSAAVILGLVGQARLVVTASADMPRPDAVTTLWKDGFLQRMTLRPFDAGHTAELLASSVGGPVAGATVELLHQWTGGNPLFLTELVRTALADGTLLEQAGLWWWRAPLNVPRDLADIIGRRLDGIGTAERDALTAVALGEPLALDVLERIVPPDTVVRLEDEGLVHAEPDAGSGDLVVRFDRPVLAAAVRSRSAPARRRRIAAMLLRTAPDAPCRPVDVVKRALWHLDAGGRVDADLLLAASDVVLHAEPVLAARLAGEVTRRSPSARAAVALAAALVESGEAAEARAVLEKAAADASAPAEQILVAIALAGHRAWAERDPGGAHAELAAMVTEVRDPAARSEIRSVDALVQLFGGHADRALDAAGQVLADPAAGRPAILRARLAQAAALVLVGRTEAAVDAGERAEADALEDSAGLPYASGMALAVTALARIWRAPAPDVPAAHPQTGRWPAAEGPLLPGIEPTAWPLFDGYVRRIAGDLPGAVQRLREALVQQSGGEGLFRSEAAAWLALCLADAGSPDEAEAVLASCPPDAVAVVPGLLPWASAGVAAARGHRDEAVRLMAEAVAVARACGAKLVELGYLLYEAEIRGPAGASEVAFRIREVEGHVDAPRLVAGATATLAVAEAQRGGATDLLEHAERLERMGRPRSALEVVEAAEALTGAGPAVRSAGNRLRASHGGARATGRTALTAREAEVAALAAAALTDRQIAERLVLSVRTVESHLARAYRKLGLSSRRELGGALHH